MITFEKTSLRINVLRGKKIIGVIETAFSMDVPKEPPSFIYYPYANGAVVMDHRSWMYDSLDALKAAILAGNCIGLSDKYCKKLRKAVE